MIDKDNNVVIAEGAIDGMYINKEDTNINIDHNRVQESTPGKVNNPLIAIIGIYDSKLKVMKKAAIPNKKKKKKKENKTKLKLQRKNK